MSDNAESSNTISPHRNTLLDAIAVRTSVRTYSDEEIPLELDRQLRSTINAVNTLSGLSIQFVTDDPATFAEANASGHFTNARNYFAAVGAKDDPEAQERTGFYLERLVLTATMRGLSTVWVGGSWDKESAAKHLRIRSSEELIVGAVVGYSADHVEDLPLSERAAAAAGHRPSLTYGDLVTVSGDPNAVPDWFRSGIDAVIKAPSARNGQPVRFTFDTLTNRLRAHIEGEHTPMAFVDLGIAKLHFQLGAGGGTWAWGDDARYARDESID